MSHLIVHSHRPRCKLYQEHFCHRREKSVQDDAFPLFRLDCHAGEVFVLPDLS